MQRTCLHAAPPRSCGVVVGLGSVTAETPSEGRAGIVHHLVSSDITRSSGPLVVTTDAARRLLALLRKTPVDRRPDRVTAFRARAGRARPNWHGSLPSGRSPPWRLLGDRELVRTHYLHRAIEPLGCLRCCPGAWSCRRHAVTSSCRLESCPVSRPSLLRAPDRRQAAFTITVSSK